MLYGPGVAVDSPCRGRRSEDAEMGCEGFELRIPHAMGGAERVREEEPARFRASHR